MINTVYYETIDKLEKMGVNPDYVQGWAGGFLGNPEREEQRVTDAYSAGYEDGQNQTTDSAADWKES